MVRVLLIEDDQSLADPLQRLLQANGHEVRVAYTGPAGVEMAKSWRPDVVLCDIGLPGMDGYEVVRGLRQDSATARSRIIAVTGRDSDEDRRRALLAGFDVHLAKPVDAAALL